MKKLVFIFLCVLISLNVVAQKVTVQVVKSDRTVRSEWNILDEKYNIAFPGNEYFRDDTITLILESNKRFFFQISVFETDNHDSTLYSLRVNGETIILIKSDIEPGDHTYPFFTGVRNEEAKILGGANAVISDFPWQVYFISGNFRCGGSIIASNWILTAAHCTKDDFGSPIPSSSMAVKVGATNPFNVLDGQTYNVSQVIVNPGFDNQTLANDIALLRLAVPINTVNARPVKLVTSDDVAFGATDPGVMSWVTGWGLTQVNPKIVPSILQKVQLPIITNAQASTVWNTIPATDVMAGYLNGNKDACNGDSGGPMVVPVVDEYKLAGIVSWGSSNCNTYGAYTRVSLFESWIRTNTGISKEFWPPVPAGDSIVCKSEASGQYSIAGIPGASVYEWRLLPGNAGAVTGNTSNATVVWNSGFTGTASLMVRATVSNVVSEWSRLNLRVVLNTRFLSQSNDTVICAEQPITLNVKAEGYNLNYRWLRNGTQVQSGPSSQLNISSTTPANSGIYTCQITGSCGTANSGNINLTVYPLTNITSISPDIQVAFGNDATLQVISQGNDLVYQWQKDSVLLENTNSASLFIPGLNATNTGLYRVTVSGTCGTQLSKPVYLYVRKDNATSDPEVFLWPSVTIGEFNVALSNDAVYSVYIYNTVGHLIKEVTNCRYKTTIDVGIYAKGAYIVKVFNSSFRKSLKLIKD